MSVIVMGLSHRSAPMSLLESAALDQFGAAALTQQVMAGENVDEVLLLATCNRLEVYASASTFHGGIAEIGEAIATVTGIDREILNEHLYVHYEDRAIAHAFTVACGLDAMAVGEAQILGQLRDALARGQQAGEVGSVLNSLVQHALRVGKRAHSETDLDRYSASLVEISLRRAAEHVGPLENARVLVVGAGAMSSLVATTAARHGVAALDVVNRTAARTERLAAATGATARDWSQLPEALRNSDIILSCTGALGHVLDVDLVADSQAWRNNAPAAFIDLALPRDVAPGVAELPGALVVGLEDLGEYLRAHPRLGVRRDGAKDVGEGDIDHARDAARGAEALRQVQDLIVGEVAAFLANRRQVAVGPTVAALRAVASEVMTAELSRLDARLPELSTTQRAEVHRSVHRVVEKLLHTPTVRVKELAGSGQAGDYTQALRELFDLDHHDVATVSRPPAGGGLA
ncbi:glutamyl-tRNA reductase [Gephyromycinifex aptenodytis]|uniref:glutamyl-tRNA reductase n=1 Tax=Gephyromycinifex aptenodytis TaxID=2716227 RepID=UPI001446036B|nr:glutamyl-tRNA reductase [Gephyromycinifex aptenodytis]